jgi:hypothetical protein
MNHGAIATTLAMSLLLGVTTHADEKQEDPPKRRIVLPPVDKKPRELSKKFTKAITFKFVDENDKPIRGDFTLHQYRKGKYFENWHRYLPLNEDGEITIKEFPPEFEFGGSSKDDFYHYRSLQD